MVNTMFDLTGRAAMVTGAGSTSGIGFATARLLCDMGASVLITSTTERIHDRVRELEESGAHVLGMVGDLTHIDTAPDLVDAATERWGRLDVVIQNAGMTSLSSPSHAAGDIQQLEYSQWHAGISRNLDTTFLISKACLPVMSAAGWGRLIFVSSVTGPFMAMRAQPAYAAAKAAMVGLSRALALDTAHQGITVNAVAPGWIKTGSQTPHEFLQGQRTPVGRSAEPEEVASAICWLASPSASYITGQCIVVDGGNSIAEERGST